MVDENLSFYRCNERIIIRRIKRLYRTGRKQIELKIIYATREFIQYCTSNRFSHDTNTQIYQNLLSIDFLQIIQTKKKTEIQ